MVSNGSPSVIDIHKKASTNRWAGRNWGCGGWRVKATQIGAQNPGDEQEKMTNLNVGKSNWIALTEGGKESIPRAALRGVTYL